MNKKTTTVVEKLTCYGHVIEIIKDRLALAYHMRLNKASFDAILFAREGASTNIVRAILGHGVAIHDRNAELAAITSMPLVAEPQSQRIRQTFATAASAYNTRPLELLIRH